MKGHGQVNLDDKSYTADMTGSQLKGGIAAHDLFLLRCNVDLNLHMEENKTTGTKAIYGDFQSGPGRYHQRLQGHFRLFRSGWQDLELPGRRHFHVLW